MERSRSPMNRHRQSPALPPWLTMTPAGFRRRSRSSKATYLWPWSEDQVGGRWAGLILASCGHLCSYLRPCPRLQLG